MNNRFVLSLVFSCLAMAWTHPLWADLKPDSVILRLKKEIAGAGNDSLKIERLNDLAFFYQDYLDDKHMADSLSDEAVLVAQLTFNNKLLILAYNRFTEV